MALSKNPNAAGPAVAVPGAGDGIAVTSRAKKLDPQKDAFEKSANEEYNNLSEDQKAALCSESGSLHFVSMLGMVHVKALRRGQNREGIDTCKMYGIRMVSDKPIKIPQIPIQYDHITGVPEGVLTYKDVKAGEQFDLSTIEFMYLIIRPEYSGVCDDGKGNPNGLFLSVKTGKYFASNAKMPTPTANLKGDGSPKETVIAIDEQVMDESGKPIWVIKQEFKEKFGPLLQKERASRATTSRTKDPNLRQKVLTTKLRSMFQL
jgi:hypothetical protein